jgi:hypothetical protein
MVYEIYGVYSTSGHNVKQPQTFRSLKKAIEGLSDLNELIHPLFIILEKQRVTSAPIACYSGNTIERKANRVKSFVTGENPTRQKYGPSYWKGGV